MANRTVIGTTPNRNVRRNGDPARSWERLRWAFFLAVLVPLWLAPNPNATSFSDDPNAGREGTLLIQVIWFGLLAIGLLVTRERFAQVRRQIDVTLAMLTGWCLLSTAFALLPDVSLRRFIFSAVCVMLTVLMFSSVRSVRSILWLLLAMCIVETVTKYVVVFAFPSFGKHSATGAEAHLVGQWRGQYAHKNVAGPVCAIELTIIYAARRFAPAALLAPLAVLELVFLVMSGSKTPLVLILLMGILARVILSIRSGLLIATTVLLGLALLNTITLASVVNDDAKEFAGELIGDLTFTGRIELWRFLLHYAADFPVMGAGFQSFWQVGDLSPAVSRGNSWVVAAVYGHQGFLDTVVMIGIPGLVLTLLFVVVRPALDLGYVTNRQDPILRLFVTTWLFGLFENGTESLLLNRADATWLFLVASLVMIRRYRFADGIPPSPGERFEQLRRDRKPKVGLPPPARSRPNARKALGG